MERSRMTLDVHPEDLPPPYDTALRTSFFSSITASAPEPASAPYPVTPTPNPPYPVTPVLNRPPYPVTPDSGQPPYPIPRTHDPPGPGSRSSTQHSIRVPFPKPEPTPMPMPQPMPVRMPMPEIPPSSFSRNENSVSRRDSWVVSQPGWTSQDDQSSAANRMIPPQVIIPSRVVERTTSNGEEGTKSCKAFCISLGALVFIIILIVMVTRW